MSLPSKSEINKSSDKPITAKPLRYVIHVDEEGSVVFDFEHDELKNPGHAAYKMARLLVMMHSGDLHDLAVDGIRNRAMAGDNVSELILTHYMNMYEDGDGGPCISPTEIFSMKRARTHDGSQG